MWSPKLFCLALLVVSTGCYSTSPNDATMSSSEKPAYAMAIHGGAGVITRELLSAEKEKEYRKALNTALDIGEKILASGGSALDAVAATVISMEDDPLFNAGKGAVFTHEGRNEMDASIMTGQELNAGAIGGVTNIKNPILAARAVLEKSEHVLLTGKGAENFALAQGIESIDPTYFHTERRWNALQKLLKEDFAFVGF